MMPHALILMIIVVLKASTVYATAPSNVTIDYNIKSNNLYVHAEHVSSRLERHYIRKMVVRVNDEAQEPVYYPRQKAPWGFETDYTVKAKPKDNITVELFCSQGGTGSAQLTVPELKEGQGNP